MSVERSLLAEVKSLNSRTRFTVTEFPNVEDIVDTVSDSAL